MAVGRALRHDAGGDGAARTAAVLDHERSSELLAELVGDQAPDDVGGAAGREADHDAHRLRGPGLRKGEKRQRCQQAEEGAEHRQSIMNPKGRTMEKSKREFLKAGAGVAAMAAMPGALAQTPSTQP